MPLSFATLDRGEIAFGFFNIESDMLLLERHFLFADAFCRELCEVAAGEAGAPFRRSLRVFTIPRHEVVGDLMGGIHGVRFTGFIGETYRRYPFPERPEDFRQNPEGHRTRSEFTEMIRPFAEEGEIPFEGDPDPTLVRVGGYGFSREGFQALVDYVWRGGHPRWRDDVRPDYVLQMHEALTGSTHWLTRGYGT